METEDSTVDDNLQNTQPEKITTKRKSSRKRHITIFIVVSLLNVGLLALLWPELLTPAQNQSAASSDGPSVANPFKGRPAPSFKLGTVSMKQASALDLASLKAQAV